MPRSYPPLSAWGRGSDNVVVNRFNMKTTPGSGSTTVDNIAILGQNVSGSVASPGLRVYRDNGDNTFVAATDNLVGSAVSFAADNTATLSGFSETVTEAGANYWIVLTLLPGPANGATLGARVTSVRTALVAGSQVSTSNASPGTRVDTGLPSSAIGTSGYVIAHDPVTIVGTAADNVSGVKWVDVTLRNGTGNYWDNGTSSFSSGAAVCQRRSPVWSEWRPFQIIASRPATKPAHAST